MLSTEITRKEYWPEYIRENDQRFRRGGAIALRNRIEIRPIVLPVCQLFRFTRHVVSRPLLYRGPVVAYIRRSAKRTDGRCRLCARETDLRGVFVHARKT